MAVIFGTSEGWDYLEVYEVEELAPYIREGWVLTGCDVSRLADPEYRTQFRLEWPTELGEPVYPTATERSDWVQCFVGYVGQLTTSPRRAKEATRSRSSPGPVPAEER
jgi:hypothetical protein